ncbi:MAG: stage III sporulation protein AE, partial [Peptostreptococcaceae bacterium]
MKKIVGILLTLLIISSLSISVLANENDQQDYDEAKNSIDYYIDNQLSKINIDEIENQIKGDSAVKDIDLSQFIKDLITGKQNILDLFDKEKITSTIFSELKSSLRVVAIILVLALLSSILKSLENSFSSGDISKITNYIIFIMMVSLTLIGFKDVLGICYSTIDSTIGLMQVIMPVLITLLVLIGFPITSTALSPLFLGGVTLINIVFKKFMFFSLTISFAILIVNNLSQSIKLNKLSSFIKNINIAAMGAIFTIYLGLVSIQGIYVTSFDKFSVKTAKFALGNFIPVVGGFVSDSVDILLSSSQLIKNVFGGIGLILLIGICIIPVIKVLSVIVVYKIAAIVIE